MSGHLQGRKIRASRARSAAGPSFTPRSAPHESAQSRASRSSETRRSHPSSARPARWSVLRPLRIRRAPRRSTCVGGRTPVAVSGGSVSHQHSPEHRGLGRSLRKPGRLEGAELGLLRRQQHLQQRGVLQRRWLARAPDRQWRRLPHRHLPRSRPGRGLPARRLNLETARLHSVHGRPALLELHLEPAGQRR